MKQILFLLLFSLSSFVAIHAVVASEPIQPIQERGDNYYYLYVQFEKIKKLDYGAKIVKTDATEIGKVVSIEANEAGYLLKIEINEKVKIPMHSEFKIRKNVERKYYLEVSF